MFVASYIYAENTERMSLMPRDQFFFFYEIIELGIKKESERK